MKKKYLIIALIFSLFFINKNVFASEAIDYVKFNVPDSDKLKNIDNKFVSNFYYPDTTSRLDLQFWYAQYIKQYDNTNQYERFDSYTSSLDSNTKYTCTASSCVLTNFFSNFHVNPTIKLDTNYEIAYIFSKSDSILYHSSFDFDPSEIKFSFYAGGSYTSIDGSSDFIKYAYWKKNIGEKGTDEYNNSAVLVLGFKFSSDLYSSDDLWGGLAAISFDLEGPEKNLLVFPQGKEVRFKTSFMSMLENGTISIAGTTTDSSGGGSTSAGGRHDELDQVNGSDLSKFDSLDSCDSTDIVCHLKNLLTMIKNTFIRIGNLVSSLLNGIKSLFVPSGDALKEHFQKNYSLLADHLGFLVYPFKLISNVADRIINLKTTTSFSFAGWTFMGVSVLPSFNFDFKAILEADNIANMYNIYLVVISGIIVLGFMVLCLKKFKSMFGSDSK